MTRILEKTRSLKWVYDDVGEVIEVLNMTISRYYFKSRSGNRLGNATSPLAGRR